MRLRLGCLAAVMAVAVFGRSSMAEDLFSFTYSDLRGNFTVTPGVNVGDLGVFTAADDGDTDGEVTRLVAPVGDAFFAGDAVAGEIPGFASFYLETPLATADTNSAQLNGLGTLEIRDVDDDLISADVSGEWTNINGSAHFNGLITNVLVFSDDGMFNGTDGSSVSLIFPVDPPFNGNIINLTFGGWFADEAGPVEFREKTTLTSGVVIPEPATLSLLALGGLACLVRRRK